MSESTNGSGRKSSQAVRKHGIVKWFDLVRGFGFLVPDDGGPDIFIHVSIVRATTNSEIAEGARMEVAARCIENRWLASRILFIDMNERECNARKTRRNDMRDAPWLPASVKFFNRARGFGFLTLADDRTEAFLHIQTLRECGCLMPDAGRRFLCQVERTSKGPVVFAIRPDQDVEPGSFYEVSDGR